MTQQMRHSIPSNEAHLDMLKAFLTSSGFYECVTYSFMSQTVLENLELPMDSIYRNAVRLKNPMGEDTAYMRTTLIPDLLKVVSTNLKQKTTELRLYELGRVYYPKQIPMTELPEEFDVLTLAITGKVCDFFLLKGYVENLFTAIGVGDHRFENDGAEYFHPGRKAQIYAGDELVGEIGEIHPTVQKNFDINQRVYMVQLKLHLLYRRFKDAVKYKLLPKYPAMQRDLSLTVDKNVLSAELKNCICENGGKYLEFVEVFDVYEGAGIAPDKKSIAYTLRFRSEEGTLSEEDIAPSMEKIISELANIGAMLRS